MACSTRSTAWNAAHGQRADDPAPDLLALTVRGPRRSRAATWSSTSRLRFTAPADSGLDSALFTLNPGLTVSEISGSSGQSLDFTHENGLLDVRLPAPLAAG